MSAMVVGKNKRVLTSGPRVLFTAEGVHDFLSKVKATDIVQRTSRGGGDPPGLRVFKDLMYYVKDWERRLETRSGISTAGNGLRGERGGRRRLLKKQNEEREPKKATQRRARLLLLSTGASLPPLRVILS